jgi:glycosyltransferase involved in cell wall biosynthesis/peptidoglycan/xylan/chitin deacetylase (PgdA/CDA1 family)
VVCGEDNRAFDFLHLTTMRLAIVIDHLMSETAGTESQVVKLVRGLSDRVEIDLVCLRDSPWLQSARSTLPCNVVTLNLNGIAKPSFWAGTVALWRHLRKRRPDVVHTFFPIANIVGVLCARLAGIDTIVASRRDYGHWMNPRYLAVTRFANRFVSAIVTNSEQVRELTARVEGFAAAKITIIYNGVDLARFESLRRHDELKSALGIDPSHRVIALVGNLRPIKRHDTLIHATLAMLRARSQISLLFIGGDNGNKDEVMALVSASGLDDRVFTVRADGNVHEYLSITDIGVNCSDSEGLSNAVIEYMAAGVPCVVSEGGGNLDLIEDGVNGLTFPVGDHARLAEQLTRMLADDGLRRGFVAASLQRVRTQMSLSAMLGRFEDFYRSTTRRAEPPAPAAQPTSFAPRRILRSVAYQLASSDPVLNAMHRRISSNGVTVFMYHALGEDDDDVEAWQVVRRSDFQRQMEYLRRRYRVMSLDDALTHEAFRGSGERPAAVLTFDDGNTGTVERLIPIVEREQLPITIYVATGHILNQEPYWFDRIVNALQGKHLVELDLRAHGLGTHRFGADRGAANWMRMQHLLTLVKHLPDRQCAAVAQDVERQVGKARGAPALLPLAIADVGHLGRHPLVTLGAHTHGHEVLTMLSLQEARQSIQRSVDLLDEWAGQRVRHFAYPGGFSNAALQAMLPEMGFATAMGGDAGVWTRHSPLYAIPRIGVGRYDSLHKFKTNAVLGLGKMPRNLIVGPA